MKSSRNVASLYILCLFFLNHCFEEKVLWTSLYEQESNTSDYWVPFDRPDSARDETSPKRCGSLHLSWQTGDRWWGWWGCVIRNSLASPFSGLESWIATITCNRNPMSPMSGQEAEHLLPCAIPDDSETVQLQMGKNNGWNSGWDWRLEGENELICRQDKLERWTFPKLRLIFEKFFGARNLVKQTLQLGEMSLLFESCTVYELITPTATASQGFFCTWCATWKLTQPMIFGIAAELVCCGPNVSLKSLVSLHYCCYRVGYF